MLQVVRSQIISFVWETMSTESRVLNLITNTTHLHFSPLELFAGAVKTVTERYLVGDSVPVSFCSFLEDKLQCWLAFPSPASLLQLLHIAQRLFCTAFVLPQSKNHLEARLPLSVSEFPCLECSSERQR